MNKVVRWLVYSHIVVLVALAIFMLVGCILGALLVSNLNESAGILAAVDAQKAASFRIATALTAGTLAYGLSKQQGALFLYFDNMPKFMKGQADLLDHLKSADVTQYHRMEETNPSYNLMINQSIILVDRISTSPLENDSIDIAWDLLTTQYAYEQAINVIRDNELDNANQLKTLVYILISISCPLFVCGLLGEAIFVFRPTMNVIINNFKQYMAINSQHVRAEQQLAQMSQNLSDAVLQKWQTILQYRQIFEETVLKAELNYQTYVRLGFYYPHAKKAHEELAAVINKRTAQLDSMRTQLEPEKYSEQMNQFKQLYEDHITRRVGALKLAGASSESIAKAWQKEKRGFKDKNMVKLQGITSNILTYTMKNNLMEKILLRFSLFEVERGESLRFVLNRDLEEKNAMGLDGVDRVVLFGKRFHGLVKREHSTENWDFYRAVEEFKRARMQIPQLGQAIYKRFLVHGAPDPVNLDSGTKGKVEKAVNAMIAGTKPWNQSVFDGAQAVIVELMASDSYKRFLRQAECAELYHELRKEEMKAKETLLPLFKFAEKLKGFVVRFSMECVKSGHFEQAQDLFAEGMKLFEKVGPVCIPEADALLASCQHEHTRIQEIVARQDLATADKRACKLLSMMERLKKEWIKEFLTTAREQQATSVLPLLRVDAIHRLEKQLKSIERSVRDLKLRGELVSVTRSSHEDSMDESKQKESKTQTGPEDQKKHWYAQSIIQKEETEEEDKVRPALGRSETNDGDEDDFEGDSPRSAPGGGGEDTPRLDSAKRFGDSPPKHARSIDIRDLYDDNKSFDIAMSQKEKSKTKKSKEGDKSLVTEYFKKLTKGKFDEEEDETAAAAIKQKGKKTTSKKAELKVKPAQAATTTMKDKTYTRVPSPEPSDLLGESGQVDDSHRSISVDVHDPLRPDEQNTPRSISVASEASPLPTPMKIIAIPEESRGSDDDNVTPSVDDLQFTPNPLSDSILLDSRPIP